MNDGTGGGLNFLHFGEVEGTKDLVWVSSKTGQVQPNWTCTFFVCVTVAVVSLLTTVNASLLP